MPRFTKKELIEGVECVSSKKIANNTIEYHRENGERVIRHFFTDILTFKPNGDVVIDCGGYRSFTTKERLNRYLENANIFQERNVWYLGSWSTPKQDRIVYFDGIIIDKNGKVKNPLPQNSIDNQEKAKKNFDKLVKAYLDKVRGMEKLPRPSGGDCWYCAMHTKEGESWGDISGDTEHIKKHLRTKCIQGSLIFNALLHKGYRYPDVIFQMSRYNPDSKKDSHSMVCEALRKYFRDKLFTPTGAKHIPAKKSKTTVCAVSIQG